jgi:hypothetical protein
MGALVAIETLILALMALLLVGLLRSHAEILRRLEESPARATEPLTSPRNQDTAAFDIGGLTLSGEPIKVGVRSGGRSTLIAFLSSGCLSCNDMWNAIQRPSKRAEIPGDARLVVVTKDAEQEIVSRLRELAPVDVPVVMSTAAWEAYEVPGSPFFIHVDGLSGEIHGEGSARSWEQVLSLLQDSIADAQLTQIRSAPNDGGSTDLVDRQRSGVLRRREEQMRREDEDLRRAGIGPGHPSLYEP